MTDTIRTPDPGGSTAYSVNEDTNIELINNLHSFTPPPSSQSSRFTDSMSSPMLSSTSNCISFATLNVRGISVPTKFDAIMDDLLEQSISLVGLQETRISEPRENLLFKDYSTVHKSPYRAYWAYDQLNDPAGGVGLIVADYISKYVQKIHKHGSRFIAIDLYFPANKIKIINIYNHQQNDFTAGTKKGKPFADFVITHIKAAEAAGFKVIILGDFNLDEYTYQWCLEQGRTPAAYFALFTFLHSSNYVEQSPVTDENKEFATYFHRGVPTSKLDYIWFPDRL